MDRPFIWPWGTFVGFTSLSFLVTSSISQSIVLGLAAGAAVWLATANVSAEWRTRIAESLGVGSAPAEPQALEAAARSTSHAAAQLELLRGALDQLPEGILITAADGTVLACNAELSRLLGRPVTVRRRSGELLIDPNLLDALQGANLLRSKRAQTVKLAGHAEEFKVSIAPLPEHGGSALLFGR